LERKKGEVRGTLRPTFLVLCRVESYTTTRGGGGEKKKKGPNTGNGRRKKKKKKETPGYLVGKGVVRFGESLCINVEGKEGGGGKGGFGGLGP